MLLQYILFCLYVKPSLLLSIQISQTYCYYFEELSKHGHEKDRVTNKKIGGVGEKGERKVDIIKDKRRN